MKVMLQSLIKQIVTKQLNLEDKRFEPRSVKYAIGNAKKLRECRL